jgi:hypothetical protein
VDGNIIRIGARRSESESMVGLYKLNRSLKAPGFNPRAYEVKSRFQSLLSNKNSLLSRFQIE